MVQRVWLVVKGSRQAGQLLAHPTASRVLDSEAPLDGHSSVAGPEVDNRASSRMSDPTWSLGCLLVHQDTACTVLGSGLGSKVRAWEDHLREHVGTLGKCYENKIRNIMYKY